MMYCPQCRCEFREGFSKCADCGVGLVHSLPQVVDEGTDKVLEFDLLMRTGRIWEVELVEDALTKAGIPHFQQSEDVSGLVLAKELSPTMGPGQWWSFRVPHAFLSQAREVLSVLPIEVTTDPDIWHFNPPKEGKTFFKEYSLIVGIGLCVGLVIFFFIMFKNLLF